MRRNPTRRQVAAMREHAAATREEYVAEQVAACDRVTAHLAEQPIRLEDPMSNDESVIRRVKAVPAAEAGYTGPAHAEDWIVRYYDPEVGRWFDVGDPLPKAEAFDRKARMERAYGPGGTHL